MQSTLGTRGASLASGLNMRDKASRILSRQWDPLTNPDAVVNLGTAENVSIWHVVAFRLD